MQLGPRRWNMYLKGRCQYMYSQSTQSTLHRRHRLILVTYYHRFVILNPLTGADFLQLEHTALTGTVGLKPRAQTTTLHTMSWFRLESATVVSDIAQSNVVSCKEGVPTILTHCGVLMSIVTTK